MSPSEARPFDASAPGAEHGVRLHLGCGKRYIPGFVHVDLADFPHIDHRRSVTDLSNFAADRVSLIYASHVLEYFDRAEVHDVLCEWRRVLRPGGTLRLAVPDLEALIAVYYETGELERILGPLYGRMDIGEAGAKHFIYHKTVYDFRSLSAVLAAEGFEHIRRWDWRETSHRDIDDFSQAYFPHMDKQHGRLVSLNVEADKA